MAAEDGVRDDGVHGDGVHGDGVRDDGAVPPTGGPPQPGDGHPGLPGPAPIIDLGGDAVPVRPVKPLGPRRLARLQRELAERSRELAETGAQGSAPEGADPGLLEKQRRFAELAAQAAAANEQDPAVAPPGAQQPAAPVAPDPEQPAEVERITVVFPDDPAGGPEVHDPVHVDPALFVSRLAPEDLAGLTHIDVLPAGPAEVREASGSHAAPGDATGAGETGDTADIAEEPGGTAPPPGDLPDADEELPPGRPVPAVAAEGLELLEPREYRPRAVNRWLVLLLLAVVAALVVVLVLFVL